MLSGVLGSHFIDVKETLNFKAIIVIMYVILIIISRVVFVKSDETGVDGYVSSVLKSCQHDKPIKHNTYTVDILLVWS